MRSNFDFPRNKLFKSYAVNLIGTVTTAVQHEFWSVGYWLYVTGLELIAGLLQHNHPLKCKIVSKPNQQSTRFFF